ncbi:MAG TPA: hypothetical protein P5279_04130 [Anaerohalosphaeraceae bacterium]|jgi:hypothetical protein|nr:hypothetical protein [Anaerohalosphaeraceae bacterium]HRT49658.1 hypothetical protein [Anaerohalosphaeraceae bacterium]HRT85975.1 hypothetical protein [Anaerohalosphaeraceae bacterium]
MNAHTKNQSWIVDRGGLIIEKEARSGLESLNDWERLVYCVWVTDYMLRNAGDFANAAAMHRAFQADGKRLARQLSLPATCKAFSLSQRRLQREYFDRFEEICNEIRSAEPVDAPNERPA